MPLIAFVDSQTGIMVDISVSNHGGTFKSMFTRQISEFDARFVSLYRLVSLAAASSRTGTHLAALRSPTSPSYIIISNCARVWGLRGHVLPYPKWLGIHPAVVGADTSCACAGQALG